MIGRDMTSYIAELDEKQKVAAVWVHDKAVRAPRVFDPKKHIFDAEQASGFFGASKEDIGNWIAAAVAKDRGKHTVL